MWNCRKTPWLHYGHCHTPTPLAFGLDVNICPGEQIILYATNPNANYLWQDASTLGSLIVTNPGTYTLLIGTTISPQHDDRYDDRDYQW
ncbi:MAG: hypothetical protein IPP25_03190 [Saprospiraceae bacterium]|nr:hypothetical protein [Candidatus Opimibacter skivensis]